MKKEEITKLVCEVLTSERVIGINEHCKHIMQLTQENRACVAEIKRLRAEDQDWRDKCLKLMPRLEALVQRGEAMSKPLPEATTGLDGLPSGSWVPRPKKTTVTKRKRK